MKFIGTEDLIHPESRRFDSLLPEQLADLRGSGLSDETIRQACIHSIEDPEEVSRKLGWSFPAKRLGPCTAFPFFQQDGSINCHVQLKPRHPITSKNGSVRKYENPKGKPNRIYFPPGSLGAVLTAEQTIAITEGIKKALCATQHGLPTIAVTGIWNWQKPRVKDDQGRGSGPRELITDLLQIDWLNRNVLIIFDTDPRENPSVNQAKYELAVALQQSRARPYIINIPTGPRSEGDGVHEKNALDDFVVREGGQALLDLVKEQMTSDSNTVTLEDFRAQMIENRRLSLASPGLNHDRSPTGAGKNYADGIMASLAGASLNVSPSHDNCRELVEAYCLASMNAAAYPKLDEDTCQSLPVAQKALDAGLSVSSAVCPQCPHANDCDYREQYEVAEEAHHVAVTSRRAALSDLRRLAGSRKLITIHEDLSIVLRPRHDVTVVAHLESVKAAFQVLGDEAAGRIQNSENAGYRWYSWRAVELCETLVEHMGANP